MSLSERVALLKRDYGLCMAPATLRSIYLKHNVRFRCVDVQFAAKYRMTEALKEAQYVFVTEHLARQPHKYCIWLDQSSLSVWSNVRR